MIRIYDNETPYEMAIKIWEHFEVHQSVSIFGLVKQEGKMGLVPKGEVVIKELEWLDKQENISESGRRKYRFKSGAIGGPLSQKIFVFDKKIVNSEPRITIWRVQ